MKWRHRYNCRNCNFYLTTGYYYWKVWSSSSAKRIRSWKARQLRQQVDLQLLRMVSVRMTSEQLQPWGLPRQQLLKWTFEQLPAATSSWTVTQSMETVICRLFDRWRHEHLSERKIVRYENETALKWLRNGSFTPHRMSSDVTPSQHVMTATMTTQIWRHYRLTSKRRCVQVSILHSTCKWRHERQQTILTMTSHLQVKTSLVHRVITDS